MFICQLCKKAIGPNVGSTRVVLDTRPVEYHNEYFREDEWGNKQKFEVDSRGTEIVRELVTCLPCVGEEPHTSSVQYLGREPFEEKAAAPFKVMLISSAVESIKVRLDHQTKRAERDFQFVVPNLKAYLDENKDLAL